MPVQLDTLVDHLILTELREVGIRYKHLSEGIKMEIVDAFEKYSKGGTLSYQEMTKYNRLDKFKARVFDLVKEDMENVEQLIRDGSEKIYVTTFTEGQNELLRGASLVIKMPGPPPMQVYKVVQSPMTGLTLNERLEAHRAEIILRINETLTRGLYNGDSYRDMALALKKTLDGDYVKATRIVRTEGHRVQETGLFDGAKDIKDRGFSVIKWWQSGKDKRVRPAHVMMDTLYSYANAIPLEEPFLSPTGAMGQHPGSMGSAADDINCRCLMRTEIVAPKTVYESPKTMAFPKDGFLTPKAAEEWAEKKFPHTKFDFKGGDPEVISATLRQYDKLAKEYPQVAAGIEYVGTYLNVEKRNAVFGEEIGKQLRQAINRAWAHAGNNGKFIGINAQSYGNAGVFKEQLKRSVAEGFHPAGCDCYESVITHEFGHMVHNYLLNTRNKAVMKYVRSSGVGLVNDTTRKWLAAHKVENARDLSQYATSKDVESFAEGFAAMHHAPNGGTQYKYVREQKEFIDLMYGSKWLDESEWRYYQNLTPDERRAAVREFIEFEKRYGLEGYV